MKKNEKKIRILGDSGGPLVCQRKCSCSWYIAGITSYGIGCGMANIFGVYTDVAALQPWIVSATRNILWKKKIRNAVWLPWILLSFSTRLFEIFQFRPKLVFRNFVFIGLSREGNCHSCADLSTEKSCSRVRCDDPLQAFNSSVTCGATCQCDGVEILNRSGF